MEKKNGNKSLFLYTVLIFVAALLVIIISFFSQVNMENKHNEYTGEEHNANTITEKTAQLSNENLILLETTKNLTQHNSQLMEENKELKASVERLEKKSATWDELYNIFNEIQKKNKQNAKQLFEAIDSQTLTDGQLSFYEYLKSKLK